MLDVAGDDRIHRAGDSHFEEREVVWIRQREGKRGGDDVLGVVNEREEIPDVVLLNAELLASKNLSILGHDARVNHEVHVAGNAQVNDLRGHRHVRQETGNDDVGVEDDPHPYAPRALAARTARMSALMSAGVILPAPRSRARRLMRAAANMARPRT